MDIIMRTSSERIQKGMSKVCKRVSDLSDLKLKSPEELFKKFESKRQKCWKILFEKSCSLLYSS
jgi:hypothetical protein